MYHKLLIFLDTTDRYDVGHFYSMVSSEGEIPGFFHSAFIFKINGTPVDLWEARAILLGRLGRHDQALEVYAYRMQDFVKAEE
jgi:Vam6/Vps39-like protein vacuolar protein sorting-associated protein 39